jgi:TPR repeat protein
MSRLLGWTLLCAVLAHPAQAGFDEGLAAYHAEDYTAALAEFRPLAEAGEARAQYRLGVMYNMGFGVKADPETAALWLGRAAEQDVADAQFILGVLYEQGRGVPHSQYHAFHWWRRAAVLGSLDALHKLDAYGALGPSRRRH